MGEELVTLFEDVGTAQATLDELYDAAEARYGASLDRSPEPGRSEQKWQHQLRWEVESAVLDGRIVRRRDLGRGIYELATSASALPARRPWDVVLTVPRGQDLGRWRQFNEIYVPGGGRPKDLEAGGHLWLRHDGRLVWRAEIIAIEHRLHRASSMDGTDHGPGWSLMLGVGETADVPDEDIGFRAGRWGQGFRYLDARTQQLRGAARRHGARATETRFADPEKVSADPVLSRTRYAVRTWNRIEAELLVDWIAWCKSEGRTVRRPVIKTEEGTTVRADGFDETTRLLVEAKGSSSREHVRMALGQILDYSALMDDQPHSRALLLPSPPGLSIARLLRRYDVGLVLPASRGVFVEQL